MKKKILGVGIIVIFCMTLFILTGCGEKNNMQDDENKIQKEKEQITNNNIANKEKEGLNNNSIEDTIKSYYTALYHRDSKTAYKYLDYVGIVAWSTKERTKGAEASSFTTKYNEILSDSKRTEEINKFFEDEEIYNKINNEVTYRDVTFDIKEPKDLGNDIYSVYTNVYYYMNDTKTGSSRTNYLLKKDNKYYFINDDALWDAQLLKGIIPDYGQIKLYN